MSAGGDFIKTVKQKFLEAFDGDKNAKKCSESEEFQSFRCNVARRKVFVEGHRNKEWTIYEAGPRNVECPLLFLPPVCGGPEVFYKQVMALSLDGYRVIAVDIPPFWSLMLFCDCFTQLLNFLDLKKVHLFGASIGGYLAQKYAEYSFADHRVASLILCNSFVSTAIFDREESALMYWALPSVVLKRMILGGFPKNSTDSDVVESVDFMVEQLDALSHEQLASRLTLNCALSACDTKKVAPLPITIIDVFDECAISPAARDLMYRAYPGARRASLKSGGNFPYLSRAAEINLHLKLHLRQFNKE